MSVVAWDGPWVVCDRRATNSSGRYMPVKKYKLLDDGTILAGVGDHTEVQALFRWYGTGEKYPEFQQPGDFNTLLVVSTLGDGHLYTHLPEPIKVFPPFAIGAGADIAMGAMWAGASAGKAVDIACELNIYCGNGTDYIRVGRR